MKRKTEIEIMMQVLFDCKLLHESQTKEFEAAIAEGLKRIRIARFEERQTKNR